MKKSYKCLLCNKPITKNYTILLNKKLVRVGYAGNDCLGYNDSGIYSCFYDVKKDIITDRVKRKDCEDLKK